MDLLQALGTLMSFTAFGLVGAGVMKAFHISNDMSEMKEILRDIRRSLENNGPAVRREGAPAETLIREMDESEYAAAIHAQALQTSQSAAPLVRSINAESELPVLTSNVLNAEVLNAPPTRNS